LISSISYDSIQEKELFVLIAGGDEPAFEALFHRYVPRIRPVIHKMVRSEAVTKDLIQDIFLNLWIHRERLVAIESPANWIFRIVYNRTYTWLEQQARRGTHGAGVYDQQPDVGSANGTEEAVFFTETARLVRQAILRLPPQTQKIFLLSREAGLKQAVIATTLNISIQTVKNTLTNANNAIRAYLVQQGITLPLVLLGYWLI
jgi:RNA polymerase sigma-70 factor (ECF subfamily)